MPGTPRFLQNYKLNGHVKETHAARSISFRPCWNEDGIEREFQLVSFDAARGVRFFRCVICGFRIEIEDPEKASAESGE